MQSYVLPLFGALLFHVLVAAFVMQGFESQQDFYHLTDLDIFKKLKDL